MTKDVADVYDASYSEISTKKLKVERIKIFSFYLKGREFHRERTH